MNFDISSIMRELSVAALPFLFAITVHEASHGFAAYALGDDTAKRAGRLTLNPLVHIDIVGLAVLLLTKMIGWAKPVPVNYTVISRKRYGSIIVSAAGPLSNLILAIISAFLMYIFIHGVVNYIPTKYDIAAEGMLLMLSYSIKINVTLAVLNLLPLLPLDGGRILVELLPPNLAYQYAQTERWGMFIMLFLIVTGVMWKVIGPIIRILQRLLFDFVAGGLL